MCLMREKKLFHGCKFDKNNFLRLTAAAIQLIILYGIDLQLRGETISDIFGTALKRKMEFLGLSPQINGIVGTKYD